jgi:hypothetical protein
MAVNEVPETNVTYEQLIQLEYEFNDAEDDIGMSSQSYSSMFEASQALSNPLVGKWNCNIHLATTKFSTGER